MWEFNEVIDIKYLGKYVYSIKFDDGVEGNSTGNPIREASECQP